MVTVPVEQGFGPVRLVGHWHPRTVRAELDGAPLLVLGDTMYAVIARHVPPPRVLAAHRERVTLTADGEPCAVDPGRRALRRSTYNATATVAGRDYLLRQVAGKRAELYRDGELVCELRSATTAGPPVTFSWSERAAAVDVVVGVLLGHTLGAGADGFIRNLLAGSFP